VLQEVIAILRQLLPHFGQEILGIFKIKYNTFQMSGVVFSYRKYTYLCIFHETVFSFGRNCNQHNVFY